MFFSKPFISRRSLFVLAGAAIGSKFLPALADNTNSHSKTIPGSCTLFYKPEKTGNIWDTWIYYHEGKFYLYYISPGNLKTFGGWDCVALATSNDGVHWKEHGKILTAAEGVAWLGSGAVWPVRDSNGRGKFIMNFSEWRGPEDSSGKQSIFFAESRDLIHWQRLGPEYEFRPDTRWYQPNGRWDNIWPVPRREGGYYGYWAATPKNKKVGLGFGESLDGMTWRALEPPLLPEVPLGPAVAESPEVGAVHLWRNRYYALVGLNGTHPIVDDKMTVFRPGETTVIGDSPFGPFHLATKNCRLLVGNASYFTRFVDTPDGVLVNHHSWEVDPNVDLGVDANRVYMAPIKKAQWDDEGTLRLMWWEQNNLAKGEQLPVSSAKSLADSRPALLETFFDPNRILILEGVMPLPDSKDAAPAGLYLQGTGDAGTAFFVRRNGAVDYGSMRIDGTRFEKQDSVYRDLPVKDSTRFRLIRKGRITEFYLDDYLMQCYCLPEKGTGRLGLIGPADVFRELTAWYVAG